MNATFNGIEFYRITSNNESLALSQTGTTINGSPASPDPGSQIKGPDTDTFNGTIYFSNGSPTVFGTGTAFLSQVLVGQSLFAYNGSVPYLVGVVSVVTDDGELTLTSNIIASTVAAPGVDYGSTNKILRTGESFLMRIPVIPFGSSVTVPSPKFLRSPVGSDSETPTNSSLVALTQYSVAGMPNIVGTPVNIPCTVSRSNTIPGTSGSVVTYSVLPTYFWYVLNPQISSTPALDLLNPNTKFEIFVDSFLPSFDIVNNVTPWNDGDFFSLF